MAPEVYGMTPWEKWAKNNEVHSDDENLQLGEPTYASTPEV